MVWTGHNVLNKLDRGHWCGIFDIFGCRRALAPQGDNVNMYLFFLLSHFPQIISIGCSMCMVQLSIFAFMTLKIYPVMIEEHGLGPTMLMSASVLLVALTILGIFLPETKNKKLA